MADNQPNEQPDKLRFETIKVERKPHTSWLWLLVPIFVLGILALWTMNRQDPTAQQTAATGQVAAVHAAPQKLITYEGKQWTERGRSESFPAGELELAGTSDQGDKLYMNPKEGYLGGGGGKAEPNTLSQPSGRVYLLMPNGRYQPLFVIR